MKANLLHTCFPCFEQLAFSQRNQVHEVLLLQVTYLLM
jgi:hypothetical protein